MPRKGGDMAEPLHLRLGGYDVIVSIVEDLFRRMPADPQFAKFATSRIPDSRQRAQHFWSSRFVPWLVVPVSTPGGI